MAWVGPLGMDGTAFSQQLQLKGTTLDPFSVNSDADVISSQGAWGGDVQPLRKSLPPLPTLTAGLEPGEAACLRQRSARGLSLNRVQAQFSRKAQ